MRFAVLAALCLGACSHRPATAAHALPPSAVAEVELLPSGFEAGPSVRASCRRTTRLPIADSTLSDVDCSIARLSRLLRARAGEQGAALLVGRRCRGGRGEGAKLSCSAALGYAPPAAHPEPAAWSPAPSPEQVLDLDEPRPAEADQIRVSFSLESHSPGSRRLTRGYAAVAETHVPSVGRSRLGQVSASCEDCRQESLRYALRVTAGRAGAGEVTSVACFREDAGLRCVGVALVPWSS